MLRDEAEMRAFYLSVGDQPETTEAAIRARHTKPVNRGAVAPPPTKGKKRKVAVTQK